MSHGQSKHLIRFFVDQWFSPWESGMCLFPMWGQYLAYKVGTPECLSRWLSLRNLQSEDFTERNGTSAELQGGMSWAKSCRRPSKPRRQNWAYRLPTLCQRLCRGMEILSVILEGNYFDLYFIEGKAAIQRIMLESYSKRLMHSLKESLRAGLAGVRILFLERQTRKAGLFKALFSDTCLWKRTIFVSLCLKWQFYNLVEAMARNFWS